LAALHSGFPLFLGAVCALLVAVSLGIAAEEFMHWPLERRRAPAEVHFISSLGAFLVIGQVVVLIWGNDPQVLRTSIDAVYEAAGLRATQGQIIGAVVALIALGGIFAWLRWTQVGLRFRAMSSN